MLEKIKNVFQLYIFIIIITKAFNISHINYIPLINESFLLINKTAVYIKDKNFLEIKEKYIFENNDKKFNDNELDLDLQYFIQDNKIFIFVKKYMYIFSNKGNFIKKCKIFEQLPNNNYIILPYEKVIKKLNIFFYLVIYMNNDDNIVFRVYEYDFFYNINIMIYNSPINLKYLSLLKTKYFDNNYACQLMNISINDNREMLIYFLKKKNELDIIPETFEINIIKKDKVFNLIKPINNSKNDGKKNAIDSKYQEKTLICNMNNKKNYKCAINYLINNDFFEFNNISKNCSSKLYYEYINDLNKFIFYCFYSKSKLTIIELNEQFEFKSRKNYQIEDKDFINDYNFFYLFYNQKNYRILLINDNRNIRFLELKEIKEIYLRQLQEPGGGGQNPNPEPGSGSEPGQTEGDKKGNGETNDGRFDFDNKNITIPKDKINDNRDEIMGNTKPGESYELKGDGYEIRIAPMGQREEGTTSIDFSSCEDKLREKYCSDSSNCTLTVFQTETSNSNEKSLTNNVKYVVYDGNNTQLDLSVCQDEKININYALKENSNLNLTMYSEFSNKGIDILNSSDSFFNDICYSYSDGTSDMILSDRIAEIYQNYSLCDSGCDYEGINMDDSTVSCSCSVTSDDSDDEDESENLKDIFLDLFENSTFGVVKCYKLVFGSSNKVTNIGFWLFLIIIIAHIPLYILFFKDGTSLIIKYIKNEMEKYHYLININLDNPPKKNNNNLDNISENQTDMNIVKHSDNINFAKNTTEAMKNEENEETDKNFSVAAHNIILKNEKITQNKKGIIETTKDNDLIDNDTSSKRGEIKNIIIYDKSNKSDNKKNKIPYYLIQIDADNSSNNEKPPDSNYTLNNYEYETALKYETRTFWRIFYIVILSKDHILNTFILKSPLESQPLRICLLLFSYTSDLALNTLFYFSDNISDKYHYTGNHLFWYTLYNNILISVISTLLSLVLGIILEILTDSKSSIEDDFKEEEKKLREDQNYKVSDERKKEIMEKIHKILKNLKIKMIIFIVIDFIILLFFFYFVTAFCEVYQSTQTSWISDAVVSIIISFPIEMAISLAVTIIYKISLKYECQFLYKLSMKIA